jgi:hypothetical protein
MTSLWDRWRASRPAAPPVAGETPGEVRAKINHAYDKGRSDEAKRHRSHPIINMALILIAAVGAVVVFYAVREGSFSRGGAVVDSKLATAASSAGPALAQAASTAVPKIEQAAQTAGPKIEQAADKAGAALKTDTQVAADKTKALADKAAKPN